MLAALAFTVEICMRDQPPLCMGVCVDVCATHSTPAAVAVELLMSYLSKYFRRCGRVYGRSGRSSGNFVFMQSFAHTHTYIHTCTCGSSYPLFSLFEIFSKLKFHSFNRSALCLFVFPVITCTLFTLQLRFSIEIHVACNTSILLQHAMNFRFIQDYLHFPNFAFFC